VRSGDGQSAARSSCWGRALRFALSGTGHPWLARNIHHGGAPKPVLDKLATDIRSVLQIPAVANRFRELGVEPSGASATPSTNIVRRDYARWGEIIRRNNLRAD